MNLKKKIIILVVVAVILLSGALIADKLLSKSYFKEITYKEVINKMDNKENMVLCITQTECIHCKSYKPKLKKVANKYKVDIYYIDIDLLTKEETQEFVKYISISSGTPSTIFIKDGTEKTVANRLNGDVSTDKIIKKLEQHEFIK